MRLSDKFPFLTNYFEQALNTDNKSLPQSILFYGSDFEAQYILSKEIARLLNCRENKDDNCNCLNCRWINENSHPAVLTISRLDNKPEDDDSKTVISIKQSSLIKESLLNASDFHRVFIFCDKDENGNISGLNNINFQDETANSLLKIIEEPQPGVTFIFLTRYIDDVLSTIVSRSQCFFVPSIKQNNHDYSLVSGEFENYWTFERKEIFDISQNLEKLSAEHTAIKVLDSIQNYILKVFTQNPKQTILVEHIKFVENAKRQIKLGMKPINVFDDLCLKLIK